MSIYRSRLKAVDATQQCVTDLIAAIERGDVPQLRALVAEATVGGAEQRAVPSAWDCVAGSHDVVGDARRILGDVERVVRKVKRQNNRIVAP